MVFGHIFNMTNLKRTVLIIFCFQLCLNIAFLLSILISSGLFYMIFTEDLYKALLGEVC
jgi:hypothetical protein